MLVHFLFYMVYYYCVRTLKNNTRKTILPAAKTCGQKKWSERRDSNENKGDAQAQIAASAEYVSKYCTYEDGSPLDLDYLTVDDVSLLVNTALGVSSTDF